MHCPFRLATEQIAADDAVLDALKICRPMEGD
jgi:hypothetical protein